MTINKFTYIFSAAWKMLRHDPRSQPYRMFEGGVMKDAVHRKQITFQDLGASIEYWTEPGQFGVFERHTLPIWQVSTPVIVTASELNRIKLGSMEMLDFIRTKLDNARDLHEHQLFESLTNNRLVLSNSYSFYLNEFQPVPGLTEDTKAWYALVITALGELPPEGMNVDELELSPLNDPNSRQRNLSDISIELDKQPGV